MIILCTFRLACHISDLKVYDKVFAAMGSILAILNMGS